MPYACTHAGMAGALAEGVDGPPQVIVKVALLTGPERSVLKLGTQKPASTSAAVTVYDIVAVDAELDTTWRFVGT